MLKSKKDNTFEGVMNMSIIPWLVIKNAMKQNSSHTTKNTTSSESTTALPKPLSRNDISNPTRELGEHSNLDKIIMAAALNNENVIEIISKLNIYYKEIVEKDTSVINEQLLSECTTCSQLSDDFNKVLVEMAKLGYIARYNENSIEARFVQYSKTNLGFSYKALQIPTSFNEVKLTKEDILSGRNPFATVLAELQAEHPNLV